MIPTSFLFMSLLLPYFSSDRHGDHDGSHHVQYLAIFTLNYAKLCGFGTDGNGLEDTQEANAAKVTSLPTH